MIIESGRLLFVLILVGLLASGAGCAGSHERGDEAGAGGGAGSTGAGGGASGAGVAGSAGVGGAGTGRAGIGGAAGVGPAGVGPAGVGGVAGLAGSGGTVSSKQICEDWQMLSTEPVQTPFGGVEADAAVICATTDRPEVTSHDAGRVTLQMEGPGASTAAGRIDVPEQLRALLIGEPAISVESFYPDDLGGILITRVRHTDTGYAFQVGFGRPLPEQFDSWDRPMLEIKVTLTLACEGADPIAVNATTFLNWCEGPEHPIWVSSGDLCTSCDMVCELVAAPIVPEDRPDELALPRAFRAEIVPQTVINRRLALYAAHRGCREPVRYQWKVSAGEILDAGERETVWKLPDEPGAYLAQVAVHDRDCVAVATLRWRVGV